MVNSGSTETATLAAGCFWCVEAVFQRLDGVLSTVPGYAGGRTPNPRYEQVCTGLTGHAEAVRIEFDPARISYEDLLGVFWKIHDPTTWNRQGEDVGTQYRSAIFFHNDRQREVAERLKRELERANVFGAPVVTEIVPWTNFYPAEEYHRNYFAKNPNLPYCAAVIRPKVEKFLKEFKNRLKPGAAL